MKTFRYGICSGGLPENIPDLTWEQLREFHATHYSPNNAKFYTYGNLPLEGHLESASQYLPTQEEHDRKSSKSSLFAIPDVPNEIRWTAPQKYNIHCANDPSTEAPKDSTLAISYAACDIQDVYECFVLQVIAELLVEGPSAPFYKSLIESGLGK